MALVDRLRAARRHAPAGFLPFRLDGRTIGRVRADLAEHLSALGAPIVRAYGAMTLDPRLRTAAERSQEMQAVARALAARGAIRGWRDEDYAVLDGWGGRELFRLERAAVRFFGFTSYAVHVNGTVGADTPAAMWIAQRSAGKPIDPGCYDNLIGGGLAAGMAVRAVLAKEAWEEAGLKSDLTATARAAGVIRIERAVAEGYQSELIFVHDLTLPWNCTPRNTDGEVAGFRCLPMRELLAELAGNANYTVDAAAVIVDFLLRRGFVAPDDAAYGELIAAR